MTLRTHLLASIKDSTDTAVTDLMFTTDTAKVPKASLSPSGQNLLLRLDLDDKTQWENIPVEFRICDVK